MSLRGLPLLHDSRSNGEESCQPLIRVRLKSCLCWSAAIIFCIWIIFFVYSTRTLDDHLSYQVPLSVIDDYDNVGCNGIPLEARIEDLQRILASVRKEVAESSEKLDKVNRQYEQLSKEIPSKQVELKQVENEIDNARSLLRDLHDRRNVRVSLPLRPLLPMDTVVHSGPGAASNFEDIIDFSRCSITSPLRVYLYPSTVSSPLREVLQSSEYITTDAASACLFLALITDNTTDPSSLPFWRQRGANHVIVNMHPTPMHAAHQPHHAVVVQEHFDQGSFRSSIDYALPLSSPTVRSARSIDGWTRLPQLLPYSRKYLFSMVVRDRWSSFVNDTSALKTSAARSEDDVIIIDCSAAEGRGECEDHERMEDTLGSAHFVLLPPSNRHALGDLLAAMRAGAIPVLLSLSQPLPFQDHIDWSSVIVRLPMARLPEVHFVVRAMPMADVLEMRRRGRRVVEEYLMDAYAVSRTLLASLSERLRLPPRSPSPAKATPLFNSTSSSSSSFVAPIQTPVNQPTYPDDEYLGPIEAPFDSARHLYNFTSLSLYAHARWNDQYTPGGTPEFLPYAADMPASAEYYEDSAVGFRPIEPGSGKEFSLALGGNRQREQFTVVILTYNRDAILAGSLERLHRCPYLNKVIVIWNNVEREPIGAWPKLHVPVEFIRAEKNSLNNRFVPWDRIETEAVLSLDDDIDLKQHEIVFAFRVWREERTRLVGFPARQHSRFGSDMFYNSNHTCQLSMILTGAAFLHKSYLYAYTHDMPAAIREHVDKVTNCEDIAMNFLIAHITRRPPLKTTSKWTLRCPTCTDSLWSDAEHFNERHECIRHFTKIYGYNPLKYSQYRADSILFKTRIPSDMQKCFRYV